MTVTLVCWRDKDWYVGRAKEIPGVFSQGKSLVALQENLADAIRLMLAEGNDMVRTMPAFQAVHLIHRV